MIEGENRSIISSLRLQSVSQRHSHLALKYSTDAFNKKKWTKTRSLKCIELDLDIPGCNSKIEKIRLRQYDQLLDIEKRLINEPFPILYGVKPKKTRTIKLESLAGVEVTEVGLKGGAKLDEVKVLFVPKEKISFVKSILELDSPIKVESIGPAQKNSLDFLEFYKSHKKERLKITNQTYGLNKKIKKVVF